MFQTKLVFPTNFTGTELLKSSIFLAIDEKLVFKFRWEGVRDCSDGNNFSLFTEHMSFQIFLLVRHFANWTGHNLLTDNTLKEITQEVLVRCSVIVSDHNAKLVGHFQIVVGQCPVTESFFQLWAQLFQSRLS